MTMALTQQIEDIILADPLELVSRFVTRHDWLLQRQARDVIFAEIPGKWSDYQLVATWQDSEQAMHVTCRIDVQFDESQFGEIALLAALLNQQVFIGHFAFDIKNGELALRHTLALRGAGGATPEQIEDVVDIMLGECEQNFPAIYQVAKGTMRATDAAAIVMMPIMGEG